MIDYARIVPALVGPRLSYHGFKYDEEYSYPPQGNFFFSRNYWCVIQRVSIGPVDYDFESAKAVIDSGEDFPTEIPREFLLIREPGHRLWLSNRYFNAVLHSDQRSIALVPKVGVASEGIPPIQIQNTEEPDPSESWSRPPTWWAFQGEDDLRNKLKLLLAIIESEGLDWFDEQVIDTKKYHEKLERRRQNAKNRQARSRRNFQTRT